MSQKLLDAGVHFYIVSSGAGAGLQDLVWNTPGISKVFVGSRFPYAVEDTNDFLGFAPEKYVNEDTAIEQASAAYIRAKEIAKDAPALGLGMTASVPSNRPVRGGFRLFTAIVSDRGCWTWNTSLNDGGRVGTGRNVNAIGCDLLHFGVTGERSQESTYAIEPVEASAKVEERFWKRPLFLPNGQRGSFVDPAFNVFYPGTFNPIHYGHRAMANLVKGYYGKNVVYTVSADPPHKPQLGIVELLAKAAMFRAERWEPDPSPVLFTKGQPMFIDKARAFPNGRFIIGGDALETLLDPKWGSTPAATLQALSDAGAHFYAFERIVKEDGVLRQIDARQTLKDLDLFTRFGRLFTFFPAKWTPISSTEIRAGESTEPVLL